MIRLIGTVVAHHLHHHHRLPPLRLPPQGPRQLLQPLPVTVGAQRAAAVRHGPLDLPQVALAPLSQSMAATRNRETVLMPGTAPSRDKRAKETPEPLQAVPLAETALPASRPPRLTQRLTQRSSPAAQAALLAASSSSASPLSLCSYKRCCACRR